MNLRQLGKYEIVARIGRGAMGEVFRAHDPVIGRDVALKVMSPAVGDDGELRQRFHREARSAGRLNHPNIVTVHDFGEDQGRIFIAMELLEGRDLKEIIARQTPLGLEEKLDFMQQICNGVAFAHSKEVIHRDLKPANIHVAPDGHVKIMDFGIAKYAASDITGAGMIVGTPHYMSPEQVQGEKATARSDVFSLGALFYELLSYRKAFLGESLHGILAQVSSVQPEPLSRTAPGVPRRIQEVVERALEKDPLRRYASAGELGRALREARAGAAPATAVPPPVDPLAGATLIMEPPTPRSRPARAQALALAAAGGVVLLTAAGLLAYRWWGSPPSASRAAVARDPSPPPATASPDPEPAPTVIASAEPSAAAPPSAPSTSPPAPRRVERRPAPADPTPAVAPRPTTPAKPTPAPLPATARPIAPTLPPTPPPPAAPDAAAAVQDITRVLSRYRAAFEALDLEGLRSVQPGLDQRSARQLFSGVKGYEVGLTIERIHVSGLVATAECLGTYDPVPRPRGAKAPPLRQVFELRWDGRSWMIVRVHSRR